MDRSRLYQLCAGSAACFLSSAGSDAGSSLCADGLDVQAALHRLCASARPGKEEQGTLQCLRDRNPESSVNSRVCDVFLIVQDANQPRCSVLTGDV